MLLAFLVKEKRINAPLTLIGSGTAVTQAVSKNQHFVVVVVVLQEGRIRGMKFIAFVSKHDDTKEKKKKLTTSTSRRRSAVNILCCHG